MYIYVKYFFIFRSKWPKTTVMRIKTGLGQRRDAKR